MARILVIDDDESNRESLEMYFTEEGHEVISADTGEKGIGRFKENRVDLVILDIRLPDMDGFEVLKCLKGIDQDVKAIMITAFHDEQTIRKAMESGAFSYVKKPIDVGEFEAIVSRAISATSPLGGTVASIKS
ncbi:MAG TPA: response regulator [Syntrophales bacterium]|nr:response regulator [Syntrophales bacterium]HOL59937.1 response regulator [Syntrophales bacterium]HPO36224.1 response regulator [Syntrophales bacterium]